MFHVEHQKQKTMDKTKIIKEAQALANCYPSGLIEEINSEVLHYIMGEVWKISAVKGLRVIDWKEEVLKVVGFRKFMMYEYDIDEFAVDKVHKEQCFICNFEMYVA